MTTSTATVGTTTAPRRGLVRAGATAAVGGAVAALAVGGIGYALDVPMETVMAGADTAEEIPLPAFAVAAVIATVAGTALAAALARWTARPSRVFLAVALVATVLSFGPVLGAEDTTDATKVVLALAHVAVAAVVVPVLTLTLRRLDR